MLVSGAALRWWGWVLVGFAVVLVLLPAYQTYREVFPLTPASRYTRLVATLVLLLSAAVAVVVFVLPGQALGLEASAKHRFALLGHLLTGALLVLIVAASASIIAALALRPLRIRRMVRQNAQRLINDGNVVMAAVGRTLLWLSSSSLQIQDFRGEVKDVDAAGVSSALAGFLPDIGSVTAIGAPGPLDPRLEMAPFAATTISQDLEKALSDAPYGKAAAAVLSLAQRLLPRERLYVSGYLLSSPQRGLGAALSLATAAGDVVDTETLWSGDFEPAVLQRPAVARTVSGPLALALAGAVWVTFALAKRRGDQAHLRELLDTDRWQSYALVRVGLQGVKRPERVTRAIYARAVDNDPTNDTAIFNLGLAELRSIDQGDGELALLGIERLKKLDEKLDTGGHQPDPLGLSITFNLIVTRLNQLHYTREAGPAVEGRQGLEDELREEHATLTEQLERLERKLAGKPELESSRLGQLEKPLLAVWAGAAQQLDQPADGSGELEVQPAHPGEMHRRLANLLASAELGHRDLVEHYLESTGVDARTCYNLACYWAAGDPPNAEKALRNLRRSLETGTVGQKAKTDPAFSVLRRTHAAEFRRVISEGAME